jgi:cyclic-di-GMP phosphodiesterase TipF (flagellum assembly factor)
MAPADQAGLTSTIDNMLLFRCVQIVRKLAKQDRRIGIFCNLSPRSLSDEHFFPQFLDYMRENADLAGALVFEIGQDAYEARGALEARAMAKLADLGFRFSIDKVSRLDVDLIDLERSGVRFLKATGALLIAQFIKEGARPRSNILREIAHRDVAAVFRRHGVDLIAERIEDEATVVEVLELDAPYAQGHLFGPPRAIKDSLMEETAPPPGYFTGRREMG